MVKGLEKIIRHFIDGKEYSPGLVINIIEVDTDPYDNVKVIFDITNEGDVPYNLIIVGTNLKNEIRKYSEYISFDPNDVIVSYVKQPVNFDVFYAYGSIPFSQILHITQSFKSTLLHHLQNIDKLPLEYYHINGGKIDVNGKFIPRIGTSQFKDEVYLNITFRVNDVTPKVKYDLQELEGYVDEAFLSSDDTEYGHIRDAVTETFDKWSRNFYLDDTNDDLPYWMNESFRIWINLV